MPHCSSVESQSYFYNLMANFYRYSLETYNTKDVARFMQHLRFAKDSYDKALQNGLKLHQSHPTRLSAMYNYCKF